MKLLFGFPCFSTQHSRKKGKSKDNVLLFFLKKFIAIPEIKV